MFINEFHHGHVKKRNTSITYGHVNNRKRGRDLNSEPRPQARPGPVGPQALGPALVPAAPMEEQYPRPPVPWGAVPIFKWWW